jgi:cell division protein FtsL
VTQLTEERPRVENPSVTTEMQKVPRKLITAEDAVRNDKTEILVLLSIVVFAAIATVLGRHRVYALFRSKKTARLVV